MRDTPRLPPTRPTPPRYEEFVPKHRIPWANFLQRAFEVGALDCSGKPLSKAIPEFDFDQTLLSDVYERGRENHTIERIASCAHGLDFRFPSLPASPLQNATEKVNVTGVGCRIDHKAWIPRSGVPRLGQESQYILRSPDWTDEKIDSAIARGIVKESGKD